MTGRPFFCLALRSYQRNLRPICMSRGPKSVLLARAGSRKPESSVRLTVALFAARIARAGDAIFRRAEAGVVRPVDDVECLPQRLDLVCAPPRLKRFEIRMSIVFRPVCRKPLRVSNGARFEAPVPLVSPCSSHRSPPSDAAAESWGSAAGRSRTCRCRRPGTRGRSPARSAGSRRRDAGGRTTTVPFRPRC